MEHEKDPIVTWTDTSPLPIKYFGFAAWDNSLATYFYNCRGDDVRGRDELLKACKKKIVKEYDYDEFIPVPVRDHQSKRNQLVFPVYVTGDREAHILLAPGPSADGDVYEIGGFGGCDVCGEND